VQMGFSDDRAVADPIIAEGLALVPRIPASASAMIFDVDGRLLVLKPNYKKGWTIPGGQIEPEGESPWEACRRETRESGWQMTTNGSRGVCHWHELAWRQPRCAPTVCTAICAGPQ